MKFKNKLKNCGTVLLGLSIVVIISSCRNEANRAENIAQNDSASVGSPWDTADSIVKNMRVPVFPEQTFSVLDHGAIADGKTDNTVAFAKAIKTCNEIFQNWIF